VRANVGHVAGRAGTVDAGHQTRNLVNKTIIGTVTSIGRDDPTTAEAKRAATVLRILQGQEKLLDSSPWIQNIWFIDHEKDTQLSWPKEWSEKPASVTKPLGPKPVNLDRLNSSQRQAINTMLSSNDNHRITIVQGPPGTGKTSVISTFVQLAVAKGASGIWLVAQSNVAVKNIAEKLASDGFWKWKLLVSKDFHFDWFVIFSCFIYYH